MNPPISVAWYEANHNYLMAETARLRQLLEAQDARNRWLSSLNGAEANDFARNQGDEHRQSEGVEQRFANGSGGLGVRSQELGQGLAHIQGLETHAAEASHKISPVKATEMQSAGHSRSLSKLRPHIPGMSEAIHTSNHFPLQSSNSSSAPALEQICTAFELTDFERDILLLCIALEIDARFATLFAKAQEDNQKAYPTLGLALSISSNPHWSALSPQRALRRWNLIEVGAGKALTSSSLRIDERILHAALGIYHLDERLTSMVKPVQVNETLVPSHYKLAEQLFGVWAANPKNTPLPLMQLCGGDEAEKLAIAATACSWLNLKLHVLSPTNLPNSSTEIYGLMRLWEREALLNQSALLINCDNLDSNDAVRESAVSRFSEELPCPIILSVRDRRRPKNRPLITLDVYPPTSAEQSVLWHHSLGEAIADLHGQTDILVSQFNLSPLAIRTVCAETLGRIQSNWAATQETINPELTQEIQASTPLSSPSSPFPPSLLSSLWDSCRSQARPRLDDLAQRIESGSTWEDLVLPESQKGTLQEVAAHVRQRAKVYETWGFAGKSGKGLGISALFAGASGTGKTMAADVLAQELRLDLYRIDLSSVVSKYIGETEKNLRRVFDAAETGGVILLFDEADALFGKRSEVKDSHDRYANMEVSYLLQRMESYRGLAILTTNLKDSLDIAFLRRLRFVVKFPFPDAVQRAEIWRRVFPPKTPTENLDVNKLARLNVAGGNIRNIALNAAFLAAEAGEPVQMKHILGAAQSEYIKLERSLTEAEIKGWV